jgi:hypothetical protein
VQDGLCGAQFVALRTSRRFPNSCQTFYTKECSVLALAVRIRSFSGLQALVEGKPHLPQSLTRRIQEVSDLVVAGDMKRKPSAELSLRQLSDSRTLSPLCGCVVALCHVEKHLVCFQIARMLTTNPMCDGEIIPLTG